MLVDKTLWTEIVYNQEKYTVENYYKNYVFAVVE